MLSPVDCTTYPSYCRTTSIISFSAGSISARASSGSRFSISEVEPTISANRAVTVFLSACRASSSRFEVPSKAVGAKELWESTAAVGTSVFKGEPQAPQNLNFGEFSASHFGQRLTSGNPHCPQKRIPSGFSLLHLLQRIWMETFVRLVYA